MGPLWLFPVSYTHLDVYKRQDKASKKNIPVFGSEVEQVKIGCLASMGLDYVDLGIQTGKMAAKVLKGEKKASEMNFEMCIRDSI